jgi:hypothetical protein
MPPANNNLAAATVLTAGTTSYPGSSAGATAESGEFFGYSGRMNHATVWYVFFVGPTYTQAPQFKMVGDGALAGNTYLQGYTLAPGADPTWANINAGWFAGIGDFGSGAALNGPTSALAPGTAIFIQCGGDTYGVAADTGDTFTFSYTNASPGSPAAPPAGWGASAGGPVSPGGATAAGHSTATISPRFVRAAGISSGTVGCDVHGTVVTPDVAAGGSYARFANATLTPALDDAAGSSDVSVDSIHRVIPGLDPAAGVSFAAVTYTPDLSGNPPISLALDLSGHYLLTPDETADETVAELAADDWETEVNTDTASDDTGLVHAAMMAPAAPPAPVNYRAVPVVVIDMPAPIVTRGRPTMPAHVGLLPSSFTARQGPRHIHAEDPQAKHPRSPRPADETPPWAARWTVDDLPSPGDGFYWLGAPSAADGTSGISKAHQFWGEQDGKAPAWHSFYPYKPSVRAIDHYLPDGGIVHHPKGLHFNSQYVEHMWLEFAGPKPQPFTWAIAGMIAGYPERDYLHYILDAGRNPDRVGFPRLSADAVYADHTIRDGLNYRSLIAYGHHGQYLTARNNMWTNRTVRARTVPNYAPRMFFGVFDGVKSRVGAFQSRGLHMKSGAIDHGAPHRYYVLGRSQGVIGQRHASHLLIFEIRFWRKALSQDQLQANFDQVSSTWQFHKYRRG